MTSAETSVSTIDQGDREATARPLRRRIAPFAVVLALISAFLTFVVLTGLTPIAPTREVVVTFLLINAATGHH